MKKKKPNKRGGEDVNILVSNYFSHPQSSSPALQFGQRKEEEEEEEEEEERRRRRIYFTGYFPAASTFFLLCPFTFSRLLSLGSTYYFLQQQQRSKKGRRD